MMPNLMRDDIGLREFAGRAETLRQLVVEAEIDVDLFVGGTVERTGGGLRLTARGRERVAIDDELRVAIRHARLLRKKAVPRLLDVVEHEGDELHFALLTRAVDVMRDRLRRRRSREQAEEVRAE